MWVKINDDLILESSEVVRVKRNHSGDLTIIQQRNGTIDTVEMSVEQVWARLNTEI